MGVRGIRRKEARRSRKPGFCEEGRRREKWLITGQEEYNGIYFLLPLFFQIVGCFIQLSDKQTNKQTNTNLKNSALIKDTTEQS